jgi:hypothetical protein
LAGELGHLFDLSSTVSGSHRFNVVAEMQSWRWAVVLDSEMNYGLNSWIALTKEYLGSFSGPTQGRWPRSKVSSAVSATLLPALAAL